MKNTVRAKNTTMGRPREFDYDEVLAKVMNVFWDLGFAKTTYAKLEEATGLKRQSLVYAFGDKQSLFREVLTHYAATQVQSIVDQLEAPGSPLDNIISTFSMWLEHARRHTTPGCLFVSTLAEIGVSDPEVTEIIGVATQRLIRAFHVAFEAAQIRGEILTTVNPLDLAKQAVAFGDGALLHCRTTGSSSLAEAAFQSFLALITIDKRHACLNNRLSCQDG